MNDAFENSIRNKLNEADIPFDQDAWKKMESLLDAGDNNKRPVGWWWWLFLLPLLGGLGWWIMQPSTADKKAADTAVSVQKTNDKSSIITVGNTNNDKLPERTTNKTNNHQLPANTSPENNTGNDQEATANKLPENRINNDGSHLPEAKAFAESKSNSKQGQQLPDDNETVSGKNTTGVNTTPAISTAYPTLITKDSALNRQQEEIHFLKIKHITNYNAYTKIKHPPEIPLNTDKQPDADPAIPRRKINSKGLYVGVTLGPDLNVAPSLNYGKVGFNLGVLAHYYFNRHWFVTTGAVYSKKLYGATKTDYTIPPGSIGSYDLVKVNANCDVLDIPINVNYTFLQVNNNTLSATLGVSNYFMLKEKYEYLYKYTPKWEKTVENENQHYLAILNVGALYQHPAGKRLVVGVQPYAKIPLRGVGLGQVKLYSAGVSFQLNLVGKKR